MPVLLLYHYQSNTNICYVLEKLQDTHTHTHTHTRTYTQNIYTLDAKGIGKCDVQMKINVTLLSNAKITFF